MCNWVGVGRKAEDMVDAKEDAGFPMKGDRTSGAGDEVNSLGGTITLQRLRERRDIYGLGRGGGEDARNGEGDKPRGDGQGMFRMQRRERRTGLGCLSEKKMAIR